MKTTKGTPKLSYLSIAVATVISTIAICYAFRPSLLSPRIAVSDLGAFPPTSYIFTTGFLVSALLFAIDGKQTRQKLQKITRCLAALSFFMLAVFPIHHGETLGNLHRLGGIIMLLAIMTSIVAQVIADRNYLPKLRLFTYCLFALGAIVSVTMSILSSSQVRVLALQGLAQYIGLFSLVGWAVMDKNNRA